MADANGDKLSIHINVEISTAALQAIVANAKRKAPKDADGNYCIATADCVSTMISRFLVAKDFDGFVLNTDNYSALWKV